MDDDLDIGGAALTARERVNLVRALDARPLLREAVRAGRLPARKALEVLPVAKGEAEGHWLTLARMLSLRELRRKVARALGPSAGQTGSNAAALGKEPWRVQSFSLSPDQLATVEEALRLAGVLLGPGAPTRRRLEIIAREFLRSHPSCAPHLAGRGRARGGGSM